MGIMKKPILLAVIAATILVAVGAGLFFAKDLLPEKLVAMLPWGEKEEGKEGEEKEEKEEKEEEQKEMVTVELEPFAVNLAGPGFNRYLRIALFLSLHEEEDKERIHKAAPGIRDGLLMLLSNKRAEDLLTLEGKSQLREEIREHINATAGKEVVLSVYFKDFLIQ